MKDIKTFENLYKISDNGIVKALERKVNMPNGGFKIIKEHYPKLSKTKKDQRITNNFTCIGSTSVQNTENLCELLGWCAVAT